MLEFFKYYAAGSTIFCFQNEVLHLTSHFTFLKYDRSGTRIEFHVNDNLLEVEEMQEIRNVVPLHTIIFNNDNTK